MSPAVSPRGRASSSGYLSIGQVLARLTPEFSERLGLPVGTTVASGNACALVFATGMHTRFGAIALSQQNAGKP